MLPSSPTSSDRLRGPGPLLVRLAVWCLCSLLFPLSVTATVLSFHLEVLGRTTALALPPGAHVEDTLAERVLKHLEAAESHELDPWRRDDLRQSWISLSTFERGRFRTFEDAFVAASYLMYGIHPDQVWPRIVKRRHAMLGAEYRDFFPEPAASPKKPCASVRRDGRWKAA